MDDQNDVGLRHTSLKISISKNRAECPLSDVISEADAIYRFLKDGQLFDTAEKTPDFTEEIEGAPDL
jgi:hypothetical protein